MLLQQRTAPAAHHGPAGSPTSHTPGVQWGAVRCRQRSRVTVAAAPQPQSSDPGLQAFAAFIGERRFHCTQCGKCCTGDGDVWVSDAEAVTIAAHLNMSLKRFLRAHALPHSSVDGFRLLRTQEESDACTFLRPDNTCAIHAVRPLQCSTYPWWPDLMDQREWDWEKANICEGFDHEEAPPTDKAEAARQLRLATAQEYRMVVAAKPTKRQPHPPPPSAVLAATAAAAGVPLPQAAAGIGAADSGSSSQGSSDEAAVGPGADGACSSAEPHSKAAATWQARLLRLQQQLAPLQDDDARSQA